VKSESTSSTQSSSLQRRFRGAQAKIQAKQKLNFPLLTSRITVIEAYGARR